MLGGMSLFVGVMVLGQDPEFQQIPVHSKFITSLQGFDLDPIKADPISNER